MIIFIIVLFTIVGITLLLGHFVGHWFDKNDKFGSRRKDCVAAIAIFKNEENAMHEWLTHYRNEGVTEFIMIDNGSTDNGPSIAKNFPGVTLIKDLRCPFGCTPGYQSEMYTDTLSKIKSEWLIVCDLDEFIFSRGDYPTIKDFLKSIPKDVGQILIQWQNFGSNGARLQPKSIIQGFTKRDKFQSIDRKGAKSESTPWGGVKSIIRTKATKGLGTHNQPINSKRYVKVKANLEIITPRTVDEEKMINGANYKKYKAKIEKLSYYALQLNHYQVQSKEKFLNRKKVDTRYKDMSDLKALKAYFIPRDKNEVMDLELANKKY